MRNIFVCFLVCVAIFARDSFGADFPCLEKIGADNTGNFMTYLMTADNSGAFSTATNPQDFVTKNRADFAKKIADDVMKHCIKPGGTYDYAVLNDMVLTEKVLIPFKFKNKDYDIDVYTDLLFENMNISFPKAILITNNSTWTPGTEIKSDDMPSKDYFSKDCYASANSVIKQFLPSQYQSCKTCSFYFDTKKKRFVGLLLKFMPSGSPQVDAVSPFLYHVLLDNADYKVAYKTFTNIANALKNTACASGKDYANINVYMVDLLDSSITPDTKAKKLPSVRIASKPISLP